MTVTLLTMQTLTGSGTAIITLLPYPHPQSPKNLIGSARITKVILGSPGEQLLHLLHTSYATESGWDRSPPAGSTYLCIFSWTNKTNTGMYAKQIHILKECLNNVYVYRCALTS